MNFFIDYCMKLKRTHKIGIVLLVVVIISVLIYMFYSSSNSTSDTATSIETQNTVDDSSDTTVDDSSGTTVTSSGTTVTSSGTTVDDSSIRQYHKIINKIYQNSEPVGISTDDLITAKIECDKIDNCDGIYHVPTTDSEPYLLFKMLSPEFFNASGFTTFKKKN